MDRAAFAELLDRFAQPFGVNDLEVAVEGSPTLTSVYPVSAFAAAAVATAARAACTLADSSGGSPVVVRQELADAWFRSPVKYLDPPFGSVWDAVAGDYASADGWIRLHTNAPRHRAAALKVLGVPEDREAVAAAVTHWRADDLETAVVGAGGAAATMRSAAAWGEHPQGVALAQEPLVWTGGTDENDTDAHAVPSSWKATADRPLAGLRVLDLTRVLAGPTATQFLAGLGADVLRIDPPDWDEPATAAIVMLGKRAARLDARTAEGMDALRTLLSQADVLVHGYRADALDDLGLGVDERRSIRPGLIDVSLTAYGQTGPWSGRRGFDSLVQMSAGIADAGMRAASAERPVPLPVQALDLGTGYLMAAAVLTGLRRRREVGLGSRWRLSLARTAVELERARDLADPAADAPPLDPLPFEIIDTPHGRAELLTPPATIPGVPLRWDGPPHPLGADAPAWRRG